MHKQKIYLKDGTLFAESFNRVVHGGRGDYVEFEKEQILVQLESLFNNDIEHDKIDTYYWWLVPINNKNVKVYLQRKTVKYADYKIGKYYVSPNFFKDFKDPEKLF